MRTKPDLLWEKESFRAWEGEGVKQRRWELSMGQWAYGWGNGLENAQPLWAAKYPLLHGADHRTTLILGPLWEWRWGRGVTAWNWMLFQQMRQKSVFIQLPQWLVSSMLNLILLAIVNSQNIDHLFPGFLTALLPGLFLSTAFSFSTTSGAKEWI